MVNNLKHLRYANEQKKASLSPGSAFYLKSLYFYNAFVREKAEKQPTRGANYLSHWVWGGGWGALKYHRLHSSLDDPKKTKFHLLGSSQNKYALIYDSNIWLIPLGILSVQYCALKTLLLKCNLIC